MDNKIENIIFDMGGVLIEWQPQEIVREFSSDAEVQQMLTTRVFSDHLWKKWDRGEVDLQAVKQGIVERTGFSFNEADRLMGVVADSLTLIEASFALLKELHGKGYDIYCLSNMPLEHYHILQQRLPVWAYFKGEVISGMMGVAKPDAAIYQHLLDKFELDPETCLFLDDYPQNVEAAQDLGINTLLFTDAVACRQQISHLLV